MAALVSLSTMWAIGRFGRMAEFVHAAERLGCDRVELNHQVTEEMLREFVALHERGEVAVSSVHDPCPLPTPAGGLRAVPQLSALDEWERVAAVDTARRTLDVARQLGAGAVVVHPGRVCLDPDLEPALRRLYPSRGDRGAEYDELLLRLRRQREARKGPHLDAARRSLMAVQAHARGLGLRVGLENRYHSYEIPLPDELAWLLGELDDRVVGFWYDTGHAQQLANLGYTRQDEWLGRFAARTLGIHLHDVSGLRDHLAPGGHDVDFAAVLPHVPATAIRVCEFSPFNEPDQVAAGLAYLRRLGFF